MAGEGRQLGVPLAAIVALGAAVVLGVYLWVPGAEPQRPSAGPAAGAKAPDAPRAGEAAPPDSPAPTRATAMPGESATGSIGITALPLRLLGTSVQEEEGVLSFARIEDVQHDVDGLVVEGQSLRARPGVVLTRVELGQVILDNHGTLERLPLDPTGGPLFAGTGGEGGAQAPGISDEERARRRELSRRLRERTDAGADRSPVLDVGGLLAEADVEPVYEGGELVGLVLDDLEPGGLYERAGLRAGDVVREVNGVGLGGEAAAADLVRSLADGDEIQIGVRREDGSDAVVTLSLEELVGRMEAAP